VDVLVGIDQAEDEFVVAVRGEAAFFVELAGNGFRIKAI
jgi:hypothetical protein